MGDSSYASNALKSTGGPSISMIDKSSAAGAGVGTYKGVMLCNRPFAGVEGGKATGGDGPKQFAVGCVPTAIGVNSIPNKDKIRRKKKETALTKHKRWLAELQKKKDNLELQYTVDYIKDAQSKDAFMEGERKIRKQAKEILKPSVKADEKASAAGETAESKDSSKSPIAQEKKADIKDTRKAAKKPVWAMTETAAAAAEESGSKEAEEQELEEEEELLGFVDGLDFEKYMDDVEIKTMMEMVNKRIGELERESKQEEAREAEAESRALMRGEAKELGGERDENVSGVGNAREGDESLLAAKEILDATDGMKSVHSTQSVAAMVRSSAQSDRGIKTSVLSGSTAMCDLLECHPRRSAAKQFFFEQHHPHTLLVPPGMRREGATIKVCKDCASHRMAGLQLLALGTPLQASHDQADGTRMDVQNAVNKLPYMNRNPAV